MKFIKEKTLCTKIIYCFFVLIVFTCLLSGCNNKNDHISTSEYESADWAFKNTGQTIQGLKGTPGIDINLGPAIKALSEIQLKSKTPRVIIAVVDTGVDYSISLLKDRIMYNSSEIQDEKDNDNNGYIDDCLSWDFYNNDNSIYDDILYDYHGTYIATTIARVDPYSKILPVKFLSGSQGDIHDALSAIQFAINSGSKVINCSWNFEEYNQELYSLMKNNPDILFICSAGNSNINTSEASVYPCSFELNNIIAVTAINNNGDLYDTAGYGKDVDIAAPGVNVRAYLPEDNEEMLNGTSISTAFVSAAAALMLTFDPDLSPSEIKNIMITTSSKSDSLLSLCKAEGYLNIYGCISKVLSVSKEY